jgi:hypothetical protein
MRAGMETRIAHRRPSVHPSVRERGSSPALVKIFRLYDFFFRIGKLSFFLLNANNFSDSWVYNVVETRERDGCIYKKRAKQIASRLPITGI